jgi:hypothetical protein
MSPLLQLCGVSYRIDGGRSLCVGGGVKSVEISGWHEK